MLKTKLPIIYSDKFLNHNTGIAHPECPDRLLSIVQHLKSASFKSKLKWLEPSEIIIDDLKKIHTIEMIEKVKTICENNGGFLDTDTPVSIESYKIALLSTGAWVDGLNETLSGNSSIILSRPPGHHAERNRSMGFCIFSNAAMAAVKALENSYINRVAIFDWDVHHGNGTEDIVKTNPNILYSSIHQYPFYPGTGFESETGINNNVLNVPLQSGTNWDNYKTAFYDKILPKISTYNPDLIIISAGFDAHINDPLGNFLLSSENFGEMTAELLKFQTKTLFGLEGGYDFNALKESVEIIIKKILAYY